MAALTASAVSLFPTSLTSAEYVEGGPSTKRYLTRRLKLVLTGQGGATNTIGATALGLKTLVKCSNLFDNTNGKIYLAVIDPTTNTINLAATAADTIADVTTTAAYITVTGDPL